MRISLYFLNWNDSFYLPFIKEHYGKFCQRIVMYDNHSTDNSIRIAKSLGFEIRQFGHAGILDDQMYLDIKNHCWKEERGKSDYVIVCDADEFIVPDKLSGLMPVTTGYNMISESLPNKSIFEINTGTHSESYSKQAIFSPLVDEINFVHGCHQNYSTHRPDNGSARLFHYRCIGGIARLYAKHQEYASRMSEFNRKHGLGHHYLHSYEAKRIEWEYMKGNAQTIEI